MDQFSEKQTQIKKRLTEVSAKYPALWSNMVAEWKLSSPEDRVWLTYSANYLFRTKNIRWAIDPLTLHWRVKNAPQVDVARDLSDLSFVLLTHRHEDHLDLDLLSALRDLPILWVVPEFMLSMVMNGAGLRRENIIVAASLQPIELNGIHILPFTGVHWENTPTETRKGVPELGYLIEFDGKRLLFPGDTRTYDLSHLPAFDPVDVVFAHLWMGRASALEADPPLADDFCRFFLDLNPRRLILSHLTEYGRDADDFWDESHAQAVCSKFQEMTGNSSTSLMMIGQSSLL
jgi:L-ascorbate metabolism protein UlaG (beta-lactamase superfamily)